MYRIVTNHCLPAVTIDRLHTRALLLRGAFGPVYLVGSALGRTTWRDIDVRAVCDVSNVVLEAILSDWLSVNVRAKVDFQFRTQTQIAANYSGNPAFVLGDNKPLQILALKVTMAG